jgi:hypothetical protein
MWGDSTDVFLMIVRIPSDVACAVFILHNIHSGIEKATDEVGTSQRRSLIEHTIFVCFMKLSQI